MLLLNFSHPLTPQHLTRIQQLLDTNEAIAVRDIPTHIDPALPYAPEAVKLVDEAKLTRKEWQTTQILVNLPSYNHIAALILAEMHGRMGHFPTVVRLRPKANTTPVVFEVAEILDLQKQRDQARKERNT